MADIKFRLDEKWAVTHLKWEVAKKILEAIIQIGYAIMVSTLVWAVVHTATDPFDSGFKVGLFTRGFKTATK